MHITLLNGMGGLVIGRVASFSQYLLAVVHQGLKLNQHYHKVEHESISWWVK